MRLTMVSSSLPSPPPAFTAGPLVQLRDRSVKMSNFSASPMTPKKYRRGAIAASIRYTCADSPLGRMLVAATDKGVCAIRFAASDAELQEGLKREFPFAMRKRDDAAMQAWTNTLLRKMKGQKLSSSFPLEIRDNAFEP